MFPGCSLGGLIELRLQVMLVGALLAQAPESRDKMPRSSCPVSCSCLLPGQVSGESKTVPTQPLLGATEMCSLGWLRLTGRHWRISSHETFPWAILLGME